MFNLEERIQELKGELIEARYQQQEAEQALTKVSTERDVAQRDLKLLRDTHTQQELYIERLQSTSVSKQHQLESRLATANGEIVNLDNLFQNQLREMASEKELRSVAEEQRDHQREKQSTSQDECYELRSLVGTQSEEILDLKATIEAMQQDHLETEKILTTKYTAARKLQDQLASEKKGLLDIHNEHVALLDSQEAKLKKLEAIRKSFVTAYDQKPPYNIEPLRSVYELAKELS